MQKLPLRYLMPIIPVMVLMVIFWNEAPLTVKPNRNYSLSPDFENCMLILDNRTCLVGAHHTGNDTVFCSGPKENYVCNNQFRSYLWTKCDGRLGNVMMAYATLYYLQKLGFAAILNSYQYEVMNRNFKESGFIIKQGVYKEINTSLPIVEDYIGDNDEVGDISYGRFINNSEPWTYNRKLDIGMYPMPFNLFVEIWDDLVTQFQFRDEIMESAENAVRQSTEKFRNSHSNYSLLYIGVHFRRGDFLNLPYFKDVYSGDTMEKFFLLAFETFRQKFNSPHTRVVFLMLSDEESWMREKFSRLEDAAFPQKFSPIADEKMAGRDLAICSLCNHFIRTFGTFGLWGSLLSGGEVLYSWDDHPNRETRPIVKMNMSHHHPIDIHQFTTSKN